MSFRKLIKTKYSRAHDHVEYNRYELRLISSQSFKEYILMINRVSRIDKYDADTAASVVIVI